MALLRSYIRLLVVLLPVPYCTGQQQLCFYNITEKDGLSSNKVTCFFKDKAGYMWVGTESGLNRYNGNNWEIYKPSKDKKNLLSNSFITDVEQDEKNNIWVCTRKGLNRIDAATDTTEIFLPDAAVKNTIPGDIIWDACIDSDTSVWIAPDAKEFCQYNPVLKKFRFYDFRKFLAQTIPQNQSSYHSILKILPGRPSELWLATTDGIFSFNKQSGRFQPELAVSLREVRFFYFDKTEQKIYCVDEKNKLFCYRPATREVTTVSLNPGREQHNFVAPYSMNETLLLFPAAEGLAGMNSDNQSLFFVKGAGQRENDLLPGKVNCVYKDNQHITWIGTAAGISKFIPALNASLHLSFPANLVSDPSSVTRNFVFLPETNQWLIASHSNNTVYVADNKSGLVSTLRRPAAFQKDNCFALLHRRDTVLLLCRGSLLIYQYRLQHWDRIPLPAPFQQSVITAAAVDAAGNYWLRTIDERLIVYNTSTRKIWIPATEDFDNYAVYCLASDLQNNCVWIGTHSYGLYRYRLREQKFEYIESNNKSKTALHSYIINDIVPDGKGITWVATFEGGLARYNTSLPPDKGFMNYDVFSGLPDDNIYGIAPGPKGDIWFTTGKGIGHIDAAGNWKGLYNQQNGLPYSNFQQGIEVLPDGKIAAVTENSFICFDPSVISATSNYPVIIDNIFVNDKKIVAEPGNTGVRLFRHTQNDLSFHFSVLDFTAPGAIEYYYRLDGQDKDWIYAGKQHSIRYSKLSPGEYTLLVRAKRENGSFYEPGGRFRFKIRPAYWQAVWFRILCVLLVSGAVYWMVRRRISHIRHEAGLKQKIAESEMMALRAQMNPHFIFNCLNAIDNLVQTGQKEKATTYLARFARLIRNVLESSKYNLIPFQKDVESLQLYLQMEQFRCDNKFSFELTATDELLHSDIKVPPLIIQPFVENAIQHGLLNKQEGDRHLSVQATLENEQVHFIITDNGVGRARAQEIKELNKPGYDSYGINITRDRIHLYNKDNDPDNIKITDLWKEGQPAGTRVDIRLRLPVN
ncbi:MAG: two-component regulator propeller domain-containing protein [Chitinophagaceae bacterium]